MPVQELRTPIKHWRLERQLTQVEVAAILSRCLGGRIGQSQVSDNEKGARWSDPDLPGAYLEALGVPIDDMLAACGYPPQLAGDTPTPSMQELIRGDRTLNQAAKQHLLDEYEFLQVASRLKPSSS
jgi:transcriptional regulator with XRE-family HTH domain